MAHYSMFRKDRSGKIVGRDLIALDGRDLIMGESPMMPRGVYVVEVHTRAAEPTRLYAGPILYTEMFLGWLMAKMEECIRDHKAFIYESDVPARIQEFRYINLAHYAENVFPRLDSGKEPEEEANCDF